MAHLTLGVLGAMQVTLADGQTVKFRSDQTRALLAYLAVEADRPHRREALTGLLWPDEPEEAARHNLRQALVNLRRTIGDSAAHPPYLLSALHEIQFNMASDFALDVADFNAHLAACASHSHARPDNCAICAPRLQQAVDLYRGEFLQEFFLKNSAAFEEWALARREAFHHRALEALSALAAYYEQHGDLGATRRCALRALELDPWREQAHRQMMRVFALEGQYGAALAQYETCRRVLAEELGVEPSAETRELFEKIKSGSWKLEIGDNQRPTSNSQPSMSNLQLPTPLTPFLGRERELVDLGRLIADPNCRCISLVAPGGMGKTRLAIQAAANHRREFAQGVAFVELAAINSAESAIPALADALGFSFYGPTSPRVQLANYLRDKQMLLVLDNVEELINAAELFVELLQRAPAIKLLLTSREPLNVQGEWVVEVEGLQLPEGDKIEDSSAAALFIQRARGTRSGFELTDQDRAAVARLCRLVEGMPLALELAATWVRTLSVTEIVKEIERDLDFLHASVRDLPERHRSIRAVFDHSWKLLTAEEREILFRLSVFRGGFRREAAEPIAGATLSTLSTLVAKSLVRRRGENRYDLHELVRQFAAEHLSEHSDEQTTTRARHGSYYLTYFGRADARLKSSAQRETLAELTAEMDNFRAAWDWAVTHGEFALIEQTLHTFWLLYDTRGWFQEGLDTLDRAVNGLEMAHGHSPPERTDQVALGHLLATSAWLEYRLAHFEQAQRMLELSLAILRPLNQRHVLVEPILHLGMLMEITGNYTKALELNTEGLEISTAISDRWFATLFLTTLNGLIASTHVSADPENAHEGLRSAVADWRLIGDPRYTAFGLRLLSNSAVALGRYDEARTVLEDSAAINQSVGDRWGLGTAYRGLGIVAQALGQHQEAVVMFGKSLDTFTELGGSWWVARVLADMSRSVFVLGNHTEARRVWRESLRIATEIHATPVALEALASFASLQAEPDDMEHALELLLIVLNHPASLQETKNRAERLRVELEGRLMPQQSQAARDKARKLSIEQVINEVLEQP